MIHNLSDDAKGRILPYILEWVKAGSDASPVAVAASVDQTFASIRPLQCANWHLKWSFPLAVTPISLSILMLFSHVSYYDYIRSTGWLVILLGPATVAFAIPIYQQRGFIRRHWPVLAVGGQYCFHAVKLDPSFGVGRDPAA